METPKPQTIQEFYHLLKGEWVEPGTTPGEGEPVMGWLEAHLQNFVQPVLGFIPKRTDYTPFFSPEEKCVIKNIWRSAKAEAKRLGKPILLAGRDVFLFSVLAEREHYTNYLFEPRLSRQGALLLKSTGKYKEYLMLDTGYSGSVAKSLGCEFILASATSVETGYEISQVVERDAVGKRLPRLWRVNTHQAFPRLKEARGLAGKLESTPKYWTRARNFKDSKPYLTAQELATTKVDEYGISQTFTHSKEFEAAALLTIEIYTDSSPRFIGQRLDLKTTGNRSPQHVYGSDA